MSEHKEISRRKFIGSAVAIGATVGLANYNSIYARTNNTPSDLIRVGVVGTGSRGCALIRMIMSEMGNIKITSVCDDLQVNLDAGKELAGKEAKAYSDYKKMLDNGNLDCVFIATPPHLHADVSISALDAGLNVYCEKTLAFSIEQCKEVVKKVKETRKIFQIGQQRHYHPSYVKAVEMIHSGSIGRVTTIRAQWYRNGDWRRPVTDPKLERRINWRMYREYSAGLMAELGTHQLDIANWILKSRPIKVTGFGGIDYWKDGRETYDNAHLIYEYPNGVKVHYSAITTNAHYGASEQIMGDEGTMELTMNGAMFYKEESARKAPEKTAFGTDRTNELQKKILVTGATIKAEDPSHQKAEKIGGEIQAKDDMVGTELDTKFAIIDFFDCIRQKREPIANVEVARDACVAIHMGNLAMEKNKTIFWE